MSAWVRSSFVDAMIVALGDRPWGEGDKTESLSYEEAASYVVMRERA